MLHLDKPKQENFFWLFLSLYFVFGFLDFDSGKTKLRLRLIQI